MQKVRGSSLGMFGASGAGGAFTLIEILISLVLVLLITIGVSQVFKMAGDTVGIGNRVSEITANARSITDIMKEDLGAWAADSPVFFIRFETGTAYDTQGLPIPLIDPITNKQRVINNAPAFLQRRQDTIGFFSRGHFRRKTAEDGSTASDLTSNEAFIWYGHTVGNVPGHPYVAGGQNAAGNILGRQVILLVDPALPDKVPKLSTGDGESLIMRNSQTSYPPDLSPLTANSTSGRYEKDYGRYLAGSGKLSDSRFDVAGTTMDIFRSDVVLARAYDQKLRAYNASNPLAAADDVSSATWWYPLVSANPAVANNSLPLATAWRFNCDASVSRPVTSESLAKSSLALLDNCQDFIVEFAGDFFAQNATDGKILYGSDSYVLDPDGVVDFEIKDGARNIRWYGLENKDPNSGPITGSVPVGIAGLFETATTRSNKFMRPNQIYFDRIYDAYAQSGTPSSVKDYTCVWTNGQRMPRYIRISIRQSDPDGRLQDGIWTQFVAGPR